MEAMTNPNPTPADRMAWAICTTARPERPCRVPCAMCRAAAAAVLCVAVEQVLPEAPDGGAAWFRYNKGAEDRQRLIRYRLLAIAAELEGSNG